MCRTDFPSSPGGSRATALLALSWSILVGMVSVSSKRHGSSAANSLETLKVQGLSITGTFSFYPFFFACLVSGHPSYIPDFENFILNHTILMCAPDGFW